MWATPSRPGLANFAGQKSLRVPSKPGISIASNHRNVISLSQHGGEAKWRVNSRALCPQHKPIGRASRTPSAAPSAGVPSAPQAPQPAPSAQEPLPFLPAALQRIAPPAPQPAPRAIPLPPARPSPASPAPIDPWTAQAPDNAAALAAASAIPTQLPPAERGAGRQCGGVGFRGLDSCRLAFGDAARRLPRPGRAHGRSTLW